MLREDPPLDRMLLPTGLLLGWRCELSELRVPEMKGEDPERGADTDGEGAVRRVCG
jgi:hypothetical protein